VNNPGGKPLHWRPTAAVCTLCNGDGVVPATAQAIRGSWATTVPCRCRRPQAGRQTPDALRANLPIVKWHPPCDVFEGTERRYTPEDLELPSGHRVQVVWEVEQWTLWVLTAAPQLAAAYVPVLLFHAVTRALGGTYDVLGLTVDQTRGTWAAHELEEAVRNAARAGVAHQDIRDVVWDALIGG
jgi:hypothetical protein